MSQQGNHKSSTEQGMRLGRSARGGVCAARDNDLRSTEHHPHQRDALRRCQPQGQRSDILLRVHQRSGLSGHAALRSAPNKLETTDLIAGTGAEAKAGDTVTVNYVGVLYKGGKEFDASWKRKEPFEFKLGQGSVIAGWDQGVVGMNVDRYRELLIPFELLREGNA